MRIIAGTARSRTIEAPTGRDTRPTLDRVRENLFNILQGKTYGARVLDLFAGSGALSLEALSRGATQAVLVDNAPAACACARRNIEKLRFTEQTQLLLCDWKQAVHRLQERRFDLIFLDPPYAMEDLTEVTTALIPLLAPEGLLIVEHQADHPSLVVEGYVLQDRRKYGYAGISIYAREEET